MTEIRIEKTTDEYGYSRYRAWHESHTYLANIGTHETVHKAFGAIAEWININLPETTEYAIRINDQP